MKGKWTLLGSIVVVVVLALAVGLARAQGPQPPEEGLQPQGRAGIQTLVGTAFTYQGQLKKNGYPVNGNCDFRFSLYEDSGGPPIAVQTTTGIAVTDGLFTAVLDFGADAFQGNARWLEVAVRCPGDAEYVTLSPRQPLTPAPYALALPGLWTQQDATSPNVIGGYSGNSVTDGVYGATIGGGGASGHTNVVTDSFSTVGGGRANTAGEWGATVAGGVENKATGESSAIGGGNGNTASAYVATVSGGGANIASADGATVGGGMQNTSSGGQATIGGGHANTASGYAASVPGGEYNTAQGDYSFAAGRRARANHQGAFVWADSTDADFSSTADNQFAVRATGGVSFSIGTSNFLVNGNTVWHAGNDGSGSGLDADTVDGFHAESIALRAYNGTLHPSDGSVTIEIPHWTPFTLHLASGWPHVGGVAFVQGFENDSYVAITYIAYHGDGTIATGGAECYEGNTTTLLTFGSGIYTYTVRCPGEVSSPHNLVLTVTGSLELRYTLIY